MSAILAPITRCRLKRAKISVFLSCPQVVRAPKSRGSSQDKGAQRGFGRPILPLVSEIQAATTNAGARPQGGLTPDFLALSGRKALLRYYYAGNLELLIAIKRKYDPENFFNFQMGIPTQ